ncbi:hypothetical protein H5P28_14555 [Ruficoccus amylovorans]|uniref:Uncharacterized protein n=1 Tax=Ruficoccus amylovorans TaxID=1804625 RepID=A0A842HFP9_9BACT|nr:hypothetical protein [Ruficoccus amylovorans]MBC2595485.1 hypothetical protein [Ruficoccus amylovorans]
MAEEPLGARLADCPKRLLKLITDPTPDRAKRLMDAMMTMIKLDIPALEQAVNGSA